MAANDVVGNDPIHGPITKRDLRRLKLMTLPTARRLHKQVTDRMHRRQRQIQRLMELNEIDQKKAGKYQLAIMAKTYSFVKTTEKK